VIEHRFQVSASIGALADSHDYSVPGQRLWDAEPHLLDASRPKADQPNARRVIATTPNVRIRSNVMIADRPKRSRRHELRLSFSSHCFATFAHCDTSRSLSSRHWVVTA